MFTLISLANEMRIKKKFFISHEVSFPYRKFMTQSLLFIFYFYVKHHSSLWNTHHRTTVTFTLDVHSLFFRTWNMVMVDHQVYRLW